MPCDNTLSAEVRLEISTDSAFETTEWACESADSDCEMTETCCEIMLMAFERALSADVRFEVSTDTAFDTTDSPCDRTEMACERTLACWLSTDTFWESTLMAFDVTPAEPAPPVASAAQVHA